MERDRIDEKKNFNLLNQNLYHFIQFLSEYWKPLILLEVEVSTSSYLQKKFQILDFQRLKSSLLLKCYLKKAYVIDTINVYSNVNNWGFFLRKENISGHEIWDTEI
jgi:hypothetical protein